VTEVVYENDADGPPNQPWTSLPGAGADYARRPARPAGAGARGRGGAQPPSKADQAPRCAASAAPHRPHADRQRSARRDRQEDQAVRALAVPTDQGSGFCLVNLVNRAYRCSARDSNPLSLRSAEGWGRVGRAPGSDVPEHFHRLTTLADVLQRQLCRICAQRSWRGRTPTPRPRSHPVCLYFAMPGRRHQQYLSDAKNPYGYCHPRPGPLAEVRRSPGSPGLVSAWVRHRGSLQISVQLTP
jgi:hypothetical protein